MSTIYLHIGTPKTGTTALQNFFHKNNKVLAKYGVHYPDLGFKYSGIGYHRNGHFLAAPYEDSQGKKDFSRPSGEYETGLKKLNDLRASYERIILSDESMWRDIWRRKDHWLRIKDDLAKIGFDVKIVLYLRRQDLFVESYWAQQVKEHDTARLKKFMKSALFTSCPLDYYAYLSFLADIFGKDALFTRVYETGQYLGDGGTIQSDFLNILGISDMADFDFGQKTYNPSLSGNYLEIKRILNHIPEFASVHHPISECLKKAQEKNIFHHNFKEYTYFSPEKRIEFMAGYAKSNQKTAREFLGREDGILFYDEAKGIPELTVSREELPEDMLLVFGYAMNYLIQENQQIKKELNELKKRAILPRIKRTLRNILKE